MRGAGAAYIGQRQITAQYDANNRLSVSTDSLALSGGGTGTRYLGYDARGNITSLGTLAMSYDMSDQAVGVSGTQADGTAVGSLYAYNGEGKRVYGLTNGRETYFVYGPGGTLDFIYKEGDVESVDMIRLNNGHTLAKSTNHSSTYLHSDHLGTPLRGTTHHDSSQSVFQEYYTPFGLNPTSGWNGDEGTGFTDPGLWVNSNLNVTGFTGHPKDEGTGLTYMQARHYDPALGRFLSIDPVTMMDMDMNPGYFNRYAYTANNPINMTDPTGMYTCADEACDTATIDSTIHRSAPPIDSSLAGDPNAAPPVSVTFVNDVPGGPSTDLPVTTEMAIMVESAVVESGVDHVNINSTRGSVGVSRTSPRHANGQAVDIDQINGQDVDSPSNFGAVSDLQSAFSRQTNIRENLGPAINQKTETSGSITPKPHLAATHRDHIHVSGQK